MTFRCYFRFDFLHYADTPDDASSLMLSLFAADERRFTPAIDAASIEFTPLRAATLRSAMPLRYAAY